MSTLIKDILSGIFIIGGLGIMSIIGIVGIIRESKKIKDTE
jgi:hypothetical protein